MFNEIEGKIIDYFKGNIDYLKDGYNNFSVDYGIKELKFRYDIQNPKGFFSDCSADSIYEALNKLVTDGFICIKKGKMSRLGQIYCLTEKGFKEFFGINV